MKAFKEKQMMSQGMTMSIESSREWDQEAQTKFLNLVPASLNSKQNRSSSEKDSEIDEESSESSSSE